MIEPGNFEPESIDDIIGHARKIADIQLKKLNAGKLNRLFLLLTGKPGCGKSSVCRVLAKSLADPINVIDVSACELNVDRVREWIQDLGYAKLYGDWTVYIINECDEINRQVEILMLQLLDKAKKHVAILCTSNKANALIDRFQSRFQHHEVTPPAAHEIEKFISNKWPELKEVAGGLANSCAGDVRQSLADGQTWLDNKEYGE